MKTCYLGWESSMALGWLLELRLALGWGQVNYDQVWSPKCRRKLSSILGQNLAQDFLAPPVGVAGMSRDNLA